MDNELIPVLGVKAPWSTMINLGWKPWEVRTQKTNKRGTIALYSTRSKPDREAVQVYDNLRSCQKLEDMTPYHAVEYGKIIALADFVDCKQFESFDHFRKTDHKHLNPHSYYKEGLWYWVLENIRHVEPFDFKFKGSVVWSSIEISKLKVLPGTICVPEVPF
ncbi:hypothetical protein RE474_09665 [Methanolobus sediminis]|uniref:ASCH domain-containing protein n=1 Tax=Methanolobus sediminis TaxID=3072978 RepID=A0AA51YIB9_9EURY|nr:hypothetical protein [Methanolobus sediminis]WMW24356.1 hypothetical protein RE474_09665 [Methanolobus sediminis]